LESLNTHTNQQETALNTYHIHVNATLTPAARKASRRPDQHHAPPIAQAVAEYRVSWATPKKLGRSYPVTPRQSAQRGFLPAAHLACTPPPGLSGPHRSATRSRTRKV